jgi:hypothetical protein
MFLILTHQLVKVYHHINIDVYCVAHIDVFRYHREKHSHLHIVLPICLLPIGLYAGLQFMLGMHFCKYQHVSNGKIICAAFVNKNLYWNYVEFSSFPSELIMLQENDINSRLPVL